MHASKTVLIDVDNLTVKLGAEKVIDNISFCIHSGEFIGLIGPNGAGKTTLLKVLLGLLQPTKGAITNNAGAIGYIPQRGSMHDGQIPMSVSEVVRLGSKGDEAVARQTLADVNMSEFTSKRFTELSGGQQQRVLIAKALAANPSLLILDEPTTGIDERSQTEFYQILAKLHGRGITVVLVSHDIDTVLAQVNRVICLNRIILYDGPPEHFETDQYLPQFYATKHRVLHHKHGDGHA